MQMLRSMTGFGQAEGTFAGYAVQVEIRSVNHRYCEVNIRQPREWSRYDDMLRKTVQQQIKRGRVEVHINAERLPSAHPGVQIDWPLMHAYADAAQQIRERFALQQPLELQHLLQIPDAVQLAGQTAVLEDESEDKLRRCVEEALSRLQMMREAEGGHLQDSMEQYLKQLDEMRAAVMRLAPVIVDEYRQRLTQRIEDLLRQDHEIDEARLALEVAIFADKSSIDEELARLASHVVQFRLLMSDEEPAGRRMDFLIQEMNREVNTIGSKANHVHVTNHVVSMKAELEKLREQVQNIE